LRTGDRIARVNGQAVRSAGEMSWRIREAVAQGEPIRLETARGKDMRFSTVPMPERSLPVHPTQAYAAIGAALLCLFLLAYSPFRRRDGEVFALMLTIYPVMRFLEEVIRTDEGGSLGTGLSISQNISLLILVAIAVLWAYILKQPRGTALPAQPS
jgi:phosphatidylglycerol---prolipoprotein diacylglyceryl transferase